MAGGDGALPQPLAILFTLHAADDFRVLRLAGDLWRLFPGRRPDQSAKRRRLPAQYRDADPVVSDVSGGLGPARTGAAENRCNLAGTDDRRRLFRIPGPRSVARPHQRLALPRAFLRRKRQQPQNPSRGSTLRRRAGQPGRLRQDRPVQFAPVRRFACHGAAPRRAESPFDQLRLRPGGAAVLRRDFTNAGPRRCSRRRCCC